MVESEGRNLPYRKPLGVSRIITTLDVGDLYQRIVGNGDDPASRITVNVAESVELLDVGISKSCLLLQFALCTINGRLIHLKESSRKRPHSLERFDTPLNKQDLDILAVISENYAVSSN